LRKRKGADWKNRPVSAFVFVGRWQDDCGSLYLIIDIGMKAVLSGQQIVL
jgi:hypothetical protein